MGVTRGKRALLAACGLLPALVALAIAGCGSQAGSATVPGGTPSSASATAVSEAIPSGDWPTFDYNGQRSGEGPASTGITARDLSSLRVRRVTIHGIADSSAIELHGIVIAGAAHDVVVVTTSYGATIAVDARTGRRLWQFVAPGVNRTPGNPQVTTASPVADPSRRSVYAAAPNGLIYKLSIVTGRPLWSRRITFDPGHEKIASALNVSDGRVVAVTGGYFGDAPPYDGHVVTIDAASGRVDHVFNAECSGLRRLIRASSCSQTSTRGDSAIWGRAGAVIEPGSGRILATTGNGPFNGSSSWGDSVLELSSDAGRLLHNWTPPNQAQLDAGDTDVGSASPAILPTFHGHSLIVQGGKDSKLHLLDLARLNGTTGGPGRRLGGELDEIATPGGGQLFTAPAVWSHGARVYVFVGTDSGTAAYELVDPGHPRLRVAWQDGTSATSPVLAGGLLYSYDENDGELDVRQPVSGALVRSFAVAHGHWNSPIVVGGRVILPTGSYHDSSATSTLEILHLPGR